MIFFLLDLSGIPAGKLAAFSFSLAFAKIYDYFTWSVWKGQYNRSTQNIVLNPPYLWIFCNISYGYSKMYLFLPFEKGFMPKGRRRNAYTPATAYLYKAVSAIAPPLSYLMPDPVFGSPLCGNLFAFFREWFKNASPFPAFLGKPKEKNFFSTVSIFSGPLAGPVFYHLYSN